MAGEYIWMNGWERFQSFQTKRGRPWAPPWIRVYPALLDEPAYLDLSPETRSLLEGLWKLFARSRLTVPKDTRYLSRQLHQRVLTRQLERLNHAGWVDFCSGTVLEQRRNAFWNGSNLEVEVEVEQREPKAVTSSRDGAHANPFAARDTNGTAQGIIHMGEFIDRELAKTREAS